MAFTQIYLTTAAPSYTPPTIRGAWDDTAGAVTFALDPQKAGGGTITSVGRAETNVSTTWDVLLYRGVSVPLAAQTISGTVQLLLGIAESNASADFNWHLHVYVTQGDTDTPRGTLLTDYTEAAGTNEWPTTATGTQLNAAQTLSSLAITAGDRLVVEIGYIARNSSASSFTGALNYGTESPATFAAADLTNGSGAVTTLAGFITFSVSIAEVDTGARASQHVLNAVAGTSGAGARASQQVLNAVAGGAANARASQHVLNAIVSRQAQAAASQHVLNVIVSNKRSEWVPSGTFGPLLWYEFDSSDGSTKAWAMVELQDSPFYYHGLKEPLVLQPGRVVRAVSSDDDGSYESQHLDVQVDDMGRYIRGLLGQTDQRRLLVGRNIRLRMIDLPGWRAKEMPRTVAIGIVRSYSTD